MPTALNKMMPPKTDKKTPPTPKKRPATHTKPPARPAPAVRFVVVLPNGVTVALADRKSADALCRFLTGK